MTDGTVTMRAFADDLAELLRQLEVTRPVDLCGLSMGGYIAWQFAEHHADLLGRLVLCDTRATADNETARAGRLATADRVLAEGPAFLAESMLSKLFALKRESSGPRSSPTPIGSSRRRIRVGSPPPAAAWRSDPT
ncbi:MAG: alpha/beta fold hydrolase [Planctomycetaceae bacterium]